MRIAKKYNDLNLERKELFNYLKDNKKELIKEKKSTPINSEPISLKLLDSFKEDNEGIEYKEDIEELEVTVIANMANFMDADDDVILSGAYNKSVSEKGNSIPFIKNHVHQIDYKIADTLEVYVQEMNPKNLGIVTDINKSEALIFKGLVKKCYDEKMFELYKAGQVTQHSIGLQYMQIELALNDSDFEQEYKAWNDNIDKVINKQKALDKGMFWAVKEIKIYENSAVLFGSNALTPTISVNEISKELAVEDTNFKNDKESFNDTQKQLNKFDYILNSYF